METYSQLEKFPGNYAEWKKASLKRIYAACFFPYNICNTIRNIEMNYAYWNNVITEMENRSVVVRG